MHHVRLEKTIAVAVDGLDGLVVGHTDVVGLDAHQGPQLLVHLVDNLVPPAAPAHGEQPEVGELRWEGRRDAAQVAVRDQVRVQEVDGHEDRGGEPRPRGQEEVDERHGLFFILGRWKKRALQVEKEKGKEAGTNRNRRGGGIRIHINFGLSLSTTL